MLINKLSLLFCFFAFCPLPCPWPSLLGLEGRSAFGLSLFLFLLKRETLSSVFFSHEWRKGSCSICWIFNFLNHFAAIHTKSVPIFYFGSTSWAKWMRHFVVCEDTWGRGECRMNFFARFSLIRDFETYFRIWKNILRFWNIFQDFKLKITISKYIFRLFNIFQDSEALFAFFKIFFAILKYILGWPLSATIIFQCTLNLCT